MTDIQLKKRLQGMKTRCAQICGRWSDGRDIATVLSENFDKLMNDATTPEERAAFLKKADTDKTVRQQLCALRIEQANNYLLADQNIIPMFFEVVSLNPDERPVFQNNTMQQIRVGYIGQDGGPDTVKVVKPQDEHLVPLFYLTSAEVRYKKTDIYRGNIVDTALQTIQIAYDLAIQGDRKAFNLLTATVANGGAYGAFTFTAPNKANHVYVPHSAINTALLPTTNDIALSDNGTGSGQSNKFRYGIFKAAKKYSDQWGKAFMDGPLKPTGRILVPGAEASDLADQVTPTGTTRNKVADELLEQGYTTVDYLGVLWQVIPDNTIAAGACYVEYTRKVGEVFYKPSLDSEHVTDSYEDAKKNEEARFMKKPFGVYINSAKRVNSARIKYSSTYDTAHP